MSVVVLGGFWPRPSLPYLIHHDDDGGGGEVTSGCKFIASTEAYVQIRGGVLWGKKWN